MINQKFSTFNGFSQQTLDFFNALGQNNNKPWFEENRPLYEKYILDPMKALVSGLGEFMQDIDPDIEVRPAVNKTISRIYRDTRFSKDKSLFRCNMWIVFKRPAKNWQDAPGYFFEIFHDWYRYGMGYYTASPKTMNIFRLMIDDNPGKFLNVINVFKKHNIYELKGDTYKRAIPNDHPEEIQEWYQR